MLKCAYCGGPVHFDYKGKKPKGGTYIICYNARRGVRDSKGNLLCTPHRIRYDECEAAVLDQCHRIRPEHVLPNADEQSSLCANLNDQLQGIEGELVAIESQLENLTDQVASTKQKEIRERYEAKMVKLSERKKELETKQQETEQQLRNTETNRQSFATWQNSISDLKKAIVKDDPELRARLNLHLRELIAKIEVFSIGHRKIYDEDCYHKAVMKLRNSDEGRALLAGPIEKDGSRYSTPHRFHRHPSIQEASDGDTLAEELRSEAPGKVLRDKNFNAFLNWLMVRRMSKDGRFLRIHFTTGARIDIVPGDSIATSRVHLPKSEPDTVGDSFQVVLPDIERLSKQFNSKRRNSPIVV